MNHKFSFVRSQKKNSKLFIYYLFINTLVIFTNLKKFTSQANEFLSHKCRNKNKKMIFFSNLKKSVSPANEFLLYECRNNK